MHVEFQALSGDGLRSRALGFAPLVGLLIAACAGPSAGPVPARASEPVVGGHTSPSGGREDAVLLLRTVVEGAELVCTSSLIAPNLVVTARHCVSHLVRGLFTCTAKGELVSTDPDAGTLGTHLPADGLEFYTGKTPRTTPVAHGQEVLSTLSPSICMNDLAFVVLDQSLDLPVLPLRIGGRAQRHELVTLVGYGLDDAMSKTGELDVRTQPRTENDELEIAEVAPASADEGVVATVPPGSLLVQGPAGCLGDSGGPLTARETGAVLGVYSLLGGGGCLADSARHVFAHVPLFVALTNDAFTAAGAEPTPEDSGGGSGGGPTGSAGAGGDDASGGTPGDGGRGAAGEGDQAGVGGTSGGGGQGGKGGRGSAGHAAEESAGAPPEPVTPTSSPKPKSRGGCAVTTERNDVSGLVTLAVTLGLVLLRQRRRAVPRA